MTPAEIGDVFEEWNKTELDSYLIEITPKCCIRPTRRPVSRWLT